MLIVATPNSRAPMFETTVRLDELGSCGGNRSLKEVTTVLACDAYATRLLILWGLLVSFRRLSFLLKVFIFVDGRWRSLQSMLEELRIAVV